MTLTRRPALAHRRAGDQIRAGLVLLGCADDFRVDWQWIPAWRPADITDSGREQLRAIGFTV
jgi:metal-sulfur cluster biosynthetic enzyme